MSEQTGPPRPLGTQRDDDLLSLGTRGVAHRRAMVSLAAQIFGFTLSGRPTPAGRDATTRIHHPVPGDFVVEWTAAMRRNADDETVLKGSGILVERRREQFGEGDGAWSEDVWYVQYGPAPEDVCRWANAEFYAYPISGERWDKVSDR